MTPSIFEDEQSTQKLEDGLTTRKDAAEVAAAANSLALGGGAVKIHEQLRMEPSTGAERPWMITFANGSEVNAGVLKAALQNAKANPAAIDQLKKEYSKPGLWGPVGIGWECTETEYHAAREAAAKAGLVVIGGGTISDGVADTEAIGRQEFGLPPVGNKLATYVIAFAPADGSEAPVCNAAFLAAMLKAAGPEGGKAFVAARTMPKGWRAS